MLALTEPIGEAERPHTRLALTARVLAAPRDVVVACVLFALFSLNFGAFRVFGDGVDYYSFVQKLFGDRPHGSGYNFGTGLMNAPFYALGRAAQLALDTGSLGSHVLPASITVASIFYVLVAMTLTAWLLGRLRLPFRGFVVAAVVFGSPLWYYASFSPSYTHASDAAVFTAASVCLFRALSIESRGWYLAAGAALGLEVAIRPFNVGVVAGACIALLAFRRLAPAMVVGASSAATYGLLLLIPLALGTGLRTRASGATVGAGGGVFGPAPLTPLRMLFTVHRGLFIWTPATLLGVLGFVLLARRRPEHRRFLATLGAMGIGLLLIHASLEWWDGGWSFSMRYLASLLPLYAIGLGGLLDAVRGRARGAIVTIATACVIWSLFLGMSHAFGAAQTDGAFRLATRHSPARFTHLLWSYSRVRHLVERLR